MIRDYMWNDYLDWEFFAYYSYCWNKAQWDCIDDCKWESKANVEFHHQEKNTKMKNNTENELTEKEGKL